MLTGTHLNVCSLALRQLHIERMTGCCQPKAALRWINSIVFIAAMAVSQQLIMSVGSWPQTVIPANDAKRTFGLSEHCNRRRHLPTVYD